MNGIENIILDLGGVVIRLANEESWKKELFTIFDSEKFLAHKDQIIEFFKSFERGIISNEEFLDTLYQYRKDDNITIPQIISTWNSILKDYHPQTIQKLLKLRKQYKLYLLSNTNSIHEQAFIKQSVEQFGSYILEGIFDGIYLSHNLGYRKPVLESYKIIIEENHLDVTNTLFIDDRKENIDAAQSLGMQVRLHPFNQYIGKSII
jgi:putative hydrolase of the HAD superfamily